MSTIALPLRVLLPELVLSLVIVGCHARHAVLSDIRMSERAAARQLVSGFYEADSRRRWTERRFELFLQPPGGAEDSGAILKLEFTIPGQVIQRVGPMTITAYADSRRLTPQACSRVGSCEYSREIPASLLCTNLLPLTFIVDNALVLPNDETDAGLRPKVMPPNNSLLVRPEAPIYGARDNSGTINVPSEPKGRDLAVIVSRASLRRIKE